MEIKVNTLSLQDNKLSSIYNEGKIQKNSDKSFQSIINNEFEEKTNRIKIINKSDIIKEIQNIKENSKDISTYINKSNELSLKYNIPSKYILLTLTGNGILSLSQNNKFIFSSCQDKVNIGTQRIYTWSEDNGNNISFQKVNGSNIEELDDDEMKKILENVDKNNEEIKNYIKENIKKENKNLTIKA